MRARSAVLVSLLVHAGLAWLATRGVAVPRHHAASIASPPSEVELVDVVLIAPDEPVPAPLDAERVAAPRDRDAARTSAAVQQATNRRSAIATQPPTGEASAATAGTGETQAPSASATRSLAMRGPSLALSGEFLERIARGGHAPQAVAHSGRLDSAAGGRATIDDRVTTVHVARDGTVTFDDKSDFDVHFNLPTPGRFDEYRRGVGHELSHWFSDPEADKRLGAKEDIAARLDAHPGDCDHWTDACSTELRAHDQSAGEGLLTPIGGKMELSDAIMRRFGQDPYASRKRKLLDDTRDARAALGAQHRAEDLARSAELMQRNLQVLWQVMADPKLRREALFAMWDECAEGDDAAGAAGQRARQMVIGWIRAKLPPGSPDAFTPEEIAALAAHRQSRQAFAPYE